MLLSHKYEIEFMHKIGLVFNAVDHPVFTFYSTVGISHVSMCTRKYTELTIRQ